MVRVNITNLINDGQCYQTIRELRWPDGVACPSCASTQVIKRGFDDTDCHRNDYVIIPHQMLSPEALQGVIEAFVTREGTDYGAQDVALATKVLQVRHQLAAGTAVIVYDEGTDSCTIQPTHQLADHR